MTTLQGGVSSGWGASSDPVPQTTGTNWGATLAGVVGNAIPYVTDMLTGNASFNSAPQPVQQQPLQGGTQYQQSNYTNPTLPVQQNEVVQGIPQGSVVNTNYAPVQTNLDYTNIVNRAAVQTPNAPDFAQAPGGPTNPQFAVIQPGQNQGMPQATGPTAQPPGTTPIIGADGLIRIGRNTFSPNDVTAQGMAGDYGYDNQPAYQQQPQYMPAPQQQNPYFPQGYGPNPYVQNQLQKMGMLPQNVSSPELDAGMRYQAAIMDSVGPAIKHGPGIVQQPAMYATDNSWRGRLNRFAGAMNPAIGRQQTIADHTAQVAATAAQKRLDDQYQHNLSAGVTASGNYVNQAGQNARQENKNIVDMVGDFFKNNPNNPETKMPLIKDMMSKYPIPGPDRMRYIIGLNKDTGVNLFEYSDMQSPDEAAAYNNKLIQGQLDKQRFDYYSGVNEDRARAIALGNQLKQQSYDFHSEADKLRIQQMTTNNALASGRLEIMTATKEAVKALKSAQSERAQLELGIRKEFGHDLAEAQIAKLRVSRAATENKLIDSNVQGAKIVVDEFFKLQNQLAIATDPSVRAQLQSQMGVFGDAVPLGKPVNTGKLGADGKPVMISGSIPKQVYGAIHYLTDVAPVQKKELSDAYQKVEALDKAAKAGAVLPPVNADGSLKAVPGKLK